MPPRPNPPHCRYRPPRPTYPRPPLHRCCGRCGPAWRPQRRPRGSLDAAAPRRPGCWDAASNPAGRRSPERPELVLRYSDRLALLRQDPGQLCRRWAASGKLRGALRRRVRDRHQNPTHYHRYHRRVSECYSSLYIYLYTERPCEPVREPSGAVGTIGGARAERLHVYTARYSPKPRFA